jgi:hypothetical protein
VNGTTTYETAKKDRVPVNLPGDCLVFIIAGGFTLDSGTDVTTGRGLAYQVYDAKVLTLEPDTVVVIISGY